MDAIEPAAAFGERIYAEAVRRGAANAQRMVVLGDGAEWIKANHLFVGSGVVEAGCRTVIGQRLKQSDMEWSQRGANAIIALRHDLGPTGGLLGVKSRMSAPRI